MSDKVPHAGLPGRTPTEGDSVGVVSLGLLKACPEL